MELEFHAAILYSKFTKKIKFLFWLSATNVDKEKIQTKRNRF